MKFDRQLRPATETSWVVSYGGKTIPRWRTAAILKIDISPYISEKSSDFHEILYTGADFELDERHVIKNEKVALDRLRVRQNVFLVLKCFFSVVFNVKIISYGQKDCTHEDKMISKYQQIKQRKWLYLWLDWYRLQTSILWCTTPSLERSGWRSSAFHRTASFRYHSSCRPLIHLAP